MSKYKERWCVKIFITYFVAICSFLHVQYYLEVSVDYLPSGKIRANIRIFPQRSVFALKYPYLHPMQLPVSAQWSQRLNVKVQGKMMHKDMHKIVFQSIGINIKYLETE
jgi:hypothetical protein